MTRTDRVRDVLARDETLVDVFVRHAPHFEKLRNPAMRRVMARLVTVEQAARIADVPVDRLVRDLNAALRIETEEPPHAAAEISNVPPAARSIPHPPSLRQVELDLRDDMRAGREPLSRIMTVVAELQPSEVLLLHTIFEPVPLFGVLAKRGFLHEAARRAADDWAIWFWRAERDAQSSGAMVSNPAPVGGATPAVASADDASDGDALAPSTVWLDVRGLEPPEPLVRTLAALETLPRGHQLVQINARVPQFLLPMLAERGFACEIDSANADQVRVRIWRAPSD